MVAHHEVAFFRDNHLRHGTRVAILFRDVTFPESLAIQKDAAVVNNNAIAGQSDHSLDIAFLRVARIVEHHHVTTMNGGDPVHELVDE